MHIEKYRKLRNAAIATVSIFFFVKTSCQDRMYPQFTKWYQDPLGLKPLQLSTAFGFVWGSASVAAYLLLTKKDSAFKKNFSFFADAGMSFGYKPQFTTVAESSVGLLYDIRRSMSVGLEWNVFHFKNNVDDTYAFGLRPLARFYPYKNKKVKLFFEYGAGMSFGLTKFPGTGTGKDADTGRTGTQFNFTSKYGVGIEFHTKKKLSVQLGARHFHLSNGNIRGLKRNPSHDSNGFFTGIFYKIFP